MFRGRYDKSSFGAVVLSSSFDSIIFLLFVRFFYFFPFAERREPRDFFSRQNPDTLPSVKEDVRHNSMATTVTPIYTRTRTHTTHTHTARTHTTTTTKTTITHTTLILVIMEDITITRAARRIITCTTFLIPRLRHQRYQTHRPCRQPRPSHQRYQQCQRSQLLQRVLTIPKSPRRRRNPTTPITRILQRVIIIPRVARANPQN